MWVSIRELSKEKAITMDSIRKKIRPVKDTLLKGHWKKDGANTYLDDFAIDYINDHSYHKNLYDRTVEAEEKTEEYRQTGLTLQENFNLLSEKYLDLHTKYIDILSENNELSQELNKSEYDLKLEKLENAHQQEKIASLENNLNEKEKKLDEELQKNNSLSSDIESKEADISALKDKNNMLEQEKEAKISEIEALKKQLEETSAQLKEEQNKSIFQRIFSKKKPQKEE